MMMCEEEWEDQHPHPNPDQDHDPFLNFDFVSTLSKPKDFYKILEVDYDATEDDIRSNYIRLALKWHPDKQKDQDNATSRFQEINEAYQVLSDPVRRREYDDNGMLYIYDHDLIVKRLVSYLFNFICSFIGHTMIHSLSPGVPQPLQGPYFDMQWSWYAAFHLVNKSSYI
ncbi:hypothetical protein K2173_026711 [Erythroxylum novogranatense]|uniref:J domain-containing protein n=1 Tax=Erythroxylum novogranatense TaxID=1862640 RepID=A0AAV8TZV4_9ROSI|nr:hypothetical protein K2173_026711 [Erythroxylum novogranatense]